MYIYIYVYTHTRVYVYVRVKLCVSAYIKTCIYTYLDVYVDTDVVKGSSCPKLGALYPRVWLPGVLHP